MEYEGTEPEREGSPQIFRAGLVLFKQSFRATQELISKQHKPNVSTQCSKACEEMVVDYTYEFITYEIFRSRAALIKWAIDVGKRNGFVIAILKSDSGGAVRKPSLTLGCERSGRYKEDKRSKNVRVDAKVRKTGTKKCECPFRLKGKKLSTDDDWMLEVVCGVHNHPTAYHLEGHSYVGRLSGEEYSLLKDMSKSNMRPKDILVTMKQKDPLNTTTMKAVYNARHKYKLEEKAERSQMQQLLALLAEHQYIEWHRTSEDSEVVTDLFWAHPTSLNLLRTFPHVLLIDCTYKMNIYRMLLLEIIGMTSTNMTFSVAFVFLQHEREDNFNWAMNVLRGIMDDSDLPHVIVTDKELALMNAISRVFPTTTHLLCRRYINKNVFAKCKKLFSIKEVWDLFMTYWNLVVASPTEEDYHNHIAQFEKQFSAYPDVLNYVRSNWLDTYKDRFVAAWTDRVMHLGATMTNRVESAYVRLKRKLGSSQENFESSWLNVHNMLLLQHTGINASFEKSKMVAQHSFKMSEFRELRGNVSITALEKILDETKRVGFIGIDSVTCGCQLRRTCGLPCAHEIANYSRQGLPIPLDFVHPHWRKLDMQPTSNKNHVSNDDVLSEELDMFKQVYAQADKSGKAELLRKLRALINQENTHVDEPEIKSTIRGRPPGKIDRSTRHESFAFERVPSVQDSYSPVDLIDD